MREGIHPGYREVVFHDTSCDHSFIINSTVATDKTTTVDGVEYPLVNIDTSSASHPFYTGKERIVTAEGRVAKFNRRFNRGGE